MTQPVSARSEGAQLRMSIEIESNELSVAVEGELDMHTGERLAEAIEPFIREVPMAVLLDLRAVSFIDSGGVDSILELAERLAPTQAFLFTTGWSDTVADVFEILELPIPGTNSN